MTLFDYLAQAGFWQWIGLLMLASIVFGALSQVCLVRITRKENSDNTDDNSQHKGASHWDHTESNATWHKESP